MSLMDTFIAGLALMAVSGVTVIAYKHPEGYPKLRDVLLKVILYVGLFLAAAAFGSIGAMSSSMEQDLARDSTASLGNVAFEIAAVARWVGVLQKTVLILVPVALYLALLTLLPWFIQHKKRTDETPPPEQE